MRKLIAIPVAAALLFLAGCGSTAGDTSVKGNTGSTKGDVWEDRVTINGKTRTCWFWKSGAGDASFGGMSCDWEAK